MSPGEWYFLSQIPLRSSADQTAAQLIEAALKGRRVRIVYNGGSTPGAERCVRPVRVFIVKPMERIYLEAYCEARGAMRCFRLDRLRLLALDDMGQARPVPTPRAERVGCIILAVAVLMIALIIGAYAR